jgi:hypothetical protein
LIILIFAKYSLITVNINSMFFTAVDAKTKEESQNIKSGKRVTVSINV